MLGFLKALEQKEESRMEEKRKREEELVAEANIKKQKLAEIKENYRNARMEYGFKKGGGIVTLKNKKWHMFVSDDKLKLFVCIPNDYELIDMKKVKWQKQTIPLNNIHYFTREGSVYSETKISGGGTKPVNLVDIAVGGVIAGASGALIAARPQNESIKSETVRKDERKTILLYNETRLEFASEDYDVFMKLIPYKEFSVVQQKRATQKSELSKHSVSKEDPVEVLRKLKVMLDEGLIEQHEYDKKKEEVLKRM